MGGITATRVHCFFVAAFMVALVGCGNTVEKTSEVTGTVSYRGNALSTGAVVLYPEKGRTLDPATIGPDGVYRLEAPAGTYRVAVISMPTLQSGEGDTQKLPEQIAGSVRSLIPEFYGQPQKSGLQITVEANKPNKIDFALR